MKSMYAKTFAAVLLLLPAAAFAVYPGQWTGPYVGAHAGLNNSSLDNFSSENAFTAGIFAGYDVQLSRNIVLGGDIFYDWNQDTGHELCMQGQCGNVNFGSNVYGVDGRLGFPMGNNSQFMPYVKVGYAHLKVSGDASGSDNGWRLGGGLEWRLTPNVSVIFQYMHEKYGEDVGNWKNDNFTAGVGFRF